MPRQMSEEKQREYAELRHFFGVWTTQLFPNQYFAADNPHHPVNALTAIEQKVGLSRALSGLKQAIGDCLESVEDLQPEQIVQLDALLDQAESITLTQMLARQSKTFKSILRRGKIINETEFYLASAALSGTSIDRPEAEIAALSSIVVAYEASQRSPGRAQRNPGP